MWAHVPVTEGEQKWSSNPRTGDHQTSGPIQWQPNVELMDISGQYAVTSCSSGEGLSSTVQVWFMAASSSGCCSVIAKGSLEPLQERINVVRCFYQDGNLFIFISVSTEASATTTTTVQESEVRVYQFDGETERLSPYPGTPIKTTSQVTEVLMHPAKKMTFLLCQTTEVATYNLENLSTTSPDITDLKPYLRLIKYYYPKEATPTICRAGIIQYNDCAYVLIWAEGVPCASILTDSWTMKKFRLEGIIELPPSSEPYIDVAIAQGGQASLPTQLWTLVSSSRLKPASVESDPTGGIQAPRFFIIASTDHKLVTIPLFLTQADLLNAVVHGGVFHEIHFDSLKAIGCTPTAVLYTTTLSTTEQVNELVAKDVQSGSNLRETAEILAYSPQASQISSVIVQQTPIVARADNDRIHLLGKNWALTIPSFDAALAVPFGAADDMTDNLAAASGIGNAHAPDSQETLIIEIQPNPPAQVELQDSNNTLEGGSLSLKLFRDDVLRELDKLKTELAISTETQLADLEASIVQRLQAHTIIHIQDSLRKAVGEVEQRLAAKQDEIVNKLDRLLSALQSSESLPPMNTDPSQFRPGTNQPLASTDSALGSARSVKTVDIVTPRKITLEETDCKEFGDGFSLECIAKAYRTIKPDDAPESRAIQAFVHALQATIQQQQYDKALFNAAHYDLSHNTKGFWIMMTVREFEAKDLLKAPSKTIAMAAVRMLSESLDNWDNLPINAETTRTCIRAVWNNEFVLVPLLYVTKSYQTIEARLRWIQNGLGIAQTSVELTEEEMTMMFLLLRTKVNNLKTHLENSTSCRLPDQLRNRCVIIAELVDSALEKN